MGALGQSANRSMFEFRNDFWVNLHHFLLHQSSAGDQIPLPDSLSASERNIWLAALRDYRERFDKKNRLDPAMVAVKNAIENHEHEASLAATHLDPELIASLERAAPVYRTHWWSEHSKTNAAWIADLSGLLAKYEVAIANRLPIVYATPWPASQIRVDVTWYGPDETAYTSFDPLRTVVASSDPRNKGTNGMEILFHEASHGLVEKLRHAISEAQRAQRKHLPRQDLWHAMLFYTTGQVVAAAVNGHVPYADSEKLWERSWPGHREVFELDWKPWIEGRATFDEAVKRVVAAL